MKNPQAFFDIIRSGLAQAGGLTASQVAGINAILSEAERRKMPLNHAAYVLATAWWESGKTMGHVREGYYLGSKAEAFRKRLRYYPWYGRGLPQLTHKDNYLRMGKALGVDLVANPDLMLEPKHSIAALFTGMTLGMFTGKDLDDYIDTIDESDDEDLREFANARRIVNGTDKQVEIGKIALVFERALKIGGYGFAPVPDTVVGEVKPPLAPRPAPSDGTTAGLWAALGAATAVIAGLAAKALGLF
jgi:putative chitinase